MRVCFLAALLPVLGLLHDADHRNLVGPFDLDMGVDCAMRNLTWAYAIHLLPGRGPLLDVFDALRLSADCNYTRPTDTLAVPLSAPFYAVPSPRGGGSGARSLLRAAPPPAGSFFVDAARGSDDGAGTEGAPFATVARALAASRARRARAATIVLRGGMHQLRTPLVLDTRDSGLTLTAFPGEAPVLSGGAALSPLAWSAVGPSPSGANATVWAAPLASQPGGLRLPFGALFDPTGRRATRARFPNGNPEYDIEPVGYTKALKWLPPPPFPDNLVQQDPQLGTLPRAVCPADACTQNGPQGIGPPWAIFCCFFWGWNASVINFTTGSFWGANPGPPGGGTAHMPGGMTAGADLAPRAARWATPTDAIVHAFHGSYWGDWAWEVGGVTPINATAADLHFTRGGFQEARGAGAGDSLYVENVREELDAAGEWWVDGPSRTLFYAANGTSPPPSAGWVAGQLDNLVTLAGSAAEPVADVAIEGLTFEFSEPTFMKPFTVPSGGDWSFHDGGAVRLSGTRNCSVRGSLFINLGGTGVMLSGWNRGAEVTDNEFLWLGECAVISAGLSGDQYDNTVPGAAYGDAPVIARNLAHEFGLYVKQTGFLYAGMTANMTVVGNVFFNGPRAGINVNDGFGGGHEISRNVGFNLVRETTDHGVYNSWDRNTYLFNGPTGPTTDTAPIRMDRNLFICNYRAYFPIDNDDGSNSYVQTNNFLLWGGSKTLMGYNKHFINNTFVYADYSPAANGARKLGLTPPLGNGYGVCATSIASYPFIAMGKGGLQEQWYNNTCITSSRDAFFEWYECNTTHILDGTIPFPMKNNKYMSSTGDYVMHCRSDSLNFSAAQALGVDVGSTVGALPSLEALVDMGHDVLQF